MIGDSPTKKKPHRWGGGAGTGNRQIADGLRPHSTPKYPTCQAPAGLFRRWLAQARACAARDLAAADRAKACGDLEAFYRLRRRGLRHQSLQAHLEAVLLLRR